MDYLVEKIPDTYETTKIVYAYIRDPDQEAIPGKPTPKIRTETVITEKGGWLFTFMRGHQIRLTDEKQIALLGLSTAPRYIDDSTGLEVNKQGIPVDVEQYVTNAPLMDGGVPDTGASLVARHRGRKSDNPISDIIKDTE